LPIGGVKQKVLAAHRAGLSEVVLPERNGPDLEDVPDEVRQVMTFHLAAEIADVLTPAFSEGDRATHQSADGEVELPAVA
jgi:ATP-dependent Lon protease